MEHEPLNTSTDITAECAAQSPDMPARENDISLACPGCGITILEKVKFCQGCGHYLGEIFYYKPTQHPVKINSNIKDKYFQQDTMGALRLKMQNRTGRTLSRLEVVIDSDMIDISVMKPCLKNNIPDGRETLINLNLLPKYNGELLIKIFVTYWINEDQPNVLEGETAIYVKKPDPGQGPIVIDRSVHIDGKEAYGVDASGTININFSNKESSDILAPQHFKEGTWRPLPLMWSHESTRILRDRIRPEINQTLRNKTPEAPQEPPKGAWLRFELPDKTLCRFYLHFRPEIKIGKDMQQDIICWGHDPEGKDNNKLKCVSRKHLTLKIDSDSCWAIDHSNNGTYLDSHRLHKDKICIQNGQIINLAGVFPLKFYEYRDLSPVQNQVKHALLSFADFQKSCIRLSQIKRDMNTLPLNAVKLRKIGFYDGLEFLVVIKELDIGSAVANSLYLPCDEICELHARLMLRENMLHLADLGSTGGSWINRDRLHPYEARPVFDQDILKLGNITATIRFMQNR